jgi:hypothetical protein
MVARGFSDDMRRTNPGRFANSAPLMPSSTKISASSTVQPFRAAYSSRVFDLIA